MAYQRWIMQDERRQDAFGGRASAMSPGALSKRPRTPREVPGEQQNKGDIGD
jgi:hypothetical protein